MSAMGEIMATQPALLRELLADGGPAEAAAERVRGRRALLVGTGTSWHAANQGAWLLRAAGAEAWAVQAVDAADHDPRPGAGDALVLLSHRGTKRYTSTVLEQARDEGATTVVISGRGSPGADVETSEPEQSSAFTASHLGALMRVAQIAVALGADLGRLDHVPDAVEAVLDAPAPGVEPPGRLLELVGAGPNQWTAAEGALKVRETCYVATEGLSAEQLLHGPSVALRDGDTLVALNGGGPGEGRLLEVARLAEACGARVHTIAATYPSELLSIFPLTAAVQRIALDLAEALGTNPDSFGRDLPGRAEALAAIEL
jgi:glucosamine--fructose-6-phosphate aminotransferase (isomerizing)